MNRLHLLNVAMLALFGGTMAASAADFDVRNQSEWEKTVPADAKVQKLAGDFKFIEGPAWMPEGFLIFSDIPANKMFRWDEGKGISVFREPSHHSNGNTIDPQGRLVTCQHDSRTVTRTGQDGAVETLAETYEGKRLNSPNDVVVKGDGTIWFTDPPYGLKNQKEGKELDKQHVFRLDADGTLTSVADDFVRPNGLSFSPDEKRLYVADSAGPWDGQETRWIRVFDVTGDNRLENGRMFVQIDNGVPDGIRVDAEGRLYSSAGDGVQIFGPDGKLIGKILVPETPANLTFGGKDGKTLFITAKTSLYAIPLLTQAPR